MATVFEAIVEKKTTRYVTVDADSIEEARVIAAASTDGSVKETSTLHIAARDELIHEQREIMQGIFKGGHSVSTDCAPDV